jgi:hypothetical protein
VNGRGNEPAKGEMRMSDLGKTPEEIRAETENLKAHVDEEIERLRYDPDPHGTHEAAEQVVQEHVRRLQTEYRARRRASQSLAARAVTSPDAWMGIGAGLIAAGIVLAYLTQRQQTSTQSVQARAANATVADHDAGEADEKYFQEHYETNFAHLGRAFVTYVPAYHLGVALARDHHGKPWDELEVSAKERWEASHDEPWSSYRDAVRCGCERGQARALQTEEPSAL